MEQLTQEQEEILTGLMLGDGCINRVGSKSFRLTNTRNSEDFYYLLWQYEKLKKFYSTVPKISQYFDKRTNKTYSRCHSQTKSNLIFSEYRKIWYPNNKKSIPENLKLTPLSLLVWFLDDGCIVRYNNSLVVKFSTDGFFEKDVEFLRKLLESFIDEKFCKYKNGQNWILKSSTKAALKIIKIIEPIFLDCMIRKKTWGDLSSVKYRKNRNKYEKQLD